MGEFTIIMYGRKLILLLIFTLFPWAVQSSVRIVSPSTPIQPVLDHSNIGDTVFFRKGLYKQHDLIVRKKLVIIGEGFPVIDGESKFEVFIVTANDVIISGLQIQNIGRSSLIDMAAIKLRNSKRILVKDCRIYNATYGVYIENCSYTEVRNCIIKAVAKDELQSGNGVHAWKSSHLSIKNNSISGHRDGIYFEFVTESDICNNLSFGNIRYGLHFMFSHHDTYSHNTFSENGAGVAVMYTKDVTMLNNTFYHNWGDASYGLLLKEISDSKIENNIFAKNTVGIFMEGCSRIHVSRNTFKENGWAMRIQASCDGNTFEKNNFLGNSFDVATNGTLMLNLFTSNYWDKYDGYDLDKDGKGDVPYYPVSVYSVISEQMPSTMILYRSFLSTLMDQVEKVMPSIIPDLLKDDAPRIKKWNL